MYREFAGTPESGFALPCLDRLPLKGEALSGPGCVGPCSANAILQVRRTIFNGRFEDYREARWID
jgi:hypothetical protein